MPSKKGERKRRPINWANDKVVKAFDLAFAGRFSLDKIALECALSPRTLDDWIAHPDWQAKLTEKRANMEATLLERGISYVSKESRIIGLAQMAEMARVQYEEHELLQEKRQIGVNRDVSKDDPDFGAPLYMINETFNKDAHAAFRDALGDIAKELGHRQTKVEHGGSVDLTEKVIFVLPERDE